MGGQLCLYEPGIVLESRDGDLVIFQSRKVTHFNLHFMGIRGSVVLHTDQTGDRWAQDFNGWADSVH